MNFIWWNDIVPGAYSIQKIHIYLTVGVKIVNNISCYTACESSLVIFVSLADDCQITCLLGCSGQIYIGTTEGTVIILSTEDGRLLKKFSLHANQVRVLLELPQIIKPCICAELPIEKESSLKHNRASLPTFMQDESFTMRTWSISVSVKPKIRGKHKINIKLDAKSQGKHPLFASIGDGLANWFGNGNETTQSLEFLTWTDDFV